MIEHFIKLAWRQLVKYKLQSLVSILGLGIGFACFSMTMLWIRYERTYDTQHPEAERLYMVVGDNGLDSRAPLADYLEAHLPEVERGVRFSGYKQRIRIENIQHIAHTVFCDSNFLSVMNIKVLNGNADFWMHDDQMAVTEEFAAKVWGDESPIGKTVQGGYSDKERTVTAVVSNYGEHSNFPFSLLQGHGRKNPPTWGSGGFETLVRLHRGVDAEAFVRKIDSLRIHVDDNSGVWDYDDLKAVPLTGFRQLKTDKTDEVVLGSADGLVQFRHIRLVGLAGALLILSALLNYLTLFLNRIFIRQREMVLRTVFGGTAWSILAMLFTEYVMLLLIALWVGRFVMDSLMPWFLELTGINLSIYAIHGETILYSLGVSLIGFLLSALAINYFRRKSVQHTLQGRGAHHTYQNFRKASVVVQLIISIGFTFCTVVMMLQLEKLRHTDPGFQRENMAVLYVHENDYYEVLPSRLDEMPEVEEWYRGYSLFPRTFISTYGLKPNGEGKRVSTTVLNVSKAYRQFYGLRLKEGRWLEEGDKDVAVVTEAAVREMGLEKPIGTWLQQYEGKGFTIVGVAEDIYNEGPTVKPKPHIFVNNDEMSMRGSFVVKYHPGTWHSLKQKLAEILGDNRAGVITYSLWNCEEEFDKIILSELTLRKLMAAVSVVCILISLFGIWSMIMLNCEQRRKEIAVRKVFGATVGDILRQFAIEYGLLLVVAAAIAFPVGYVCMKPWVEQFVYQITFEWWIFVSIFVAVFLLVALCVGWRVWKTATARPADEIAKG